MNPSRCPHHVPLADGTTRCLLGRGNPPGVVHQTECQQCPVLMAIYADTEPAAATDIPPLPPVWKMLLEGTISFGTAVLHGFRRVTPEVAAERMAICEACEFFRPTDRRCGGDSGCGCFNDLKTEFEGMYCPRDYWPP